MARIDIAASAASRLNPNRLRDQLFFPVAGLVIFALVALALSPALGRHPTGPVTGDGVNYQATRIEGEYLHKIYAGGDAITAVRTPQGGRAELVIGIDAALRLDEAPELGPHFRLAADLEQQLEGRRVRVTVRAKPAEDRGAAQMRVNYSAGRVGESGWKIFDLQPGWQDFSFDYEVPKIEGDQGFDYVAIRPVVPEKSRALIVERVVIERLS